MKRSQALSERDEAERIRGAYADRSARGLDSRYDAYRPDVLLRLHQVERLLLTELGAHGWTDLRRLEVLDVGCGSGGTLLRLISHDVDPTSQVIRIGNQPFTVAGVMAVKGQTGVGQDQDDVVFVPYTTVMKKMRGIRFIQQITVSAAS